jgi:hypothetical protein
MIAPFTSASSIMLFPILHFGLASKDQSSQQDPMLMNLKWNACRTDLSFKIASNACAFDMEQVKNTPILHTTAGFHDLQFGCNLGLTALHNRI